MLIGILADTHIPYRVPKMPDAVINAFRDVDLILHAGDVDETWSLEPLKAIAPVFAVSGNYHILDGSSGGKQFPQKHEMTIAGYHIVVTHGHKLGWSTFFWKFYVLFLMMIGQLDSRWRDEYMSNKLLKQYPEADILIFGHTHRYYTQFINHRLVINPGSACQTAYFKSMTDMTVALLTLEEGQIPVVQRIDLHD